MLGQNFDHDFIRIIGSALKTNMPNHLTIVGVDMGNKGAVIIADAIKDSNIIE